MCCDKFSWNWLSGFGVRDEMSKLILRILINMDGR